MLSSCSPQEGDDLNQDVVYEDEENEYEMNFEVSEDSFGMNDDDGDDGPVYQSLFVSLFILSNRCIVSEITVSCVF